MAAPAALLCENLDTSYMDVAFVKQAFRFKGYEVNVRMVKDRNTKKTTDYCIVEMPSADKALTAYRELNGASMPGSRPDRRFKLKMCNFGNEHELLPANTLYVSELTEEVTDIELYLFFAKHFPTTRSGKVILDDKGNSKGFGYVRFDNEKDMRRALIEMQHMTGLGRKPLKVSMLPSKVKFTPKMTWSKRELQDERHKLREEKLEELRSRHRVKRVFLEETDDSLYFVHCEFPTGYKGNDEDLLIEIEELASSSGSDDGDSDSDSSDDDEELPEILRKRNVKYGPPDAYGNVRRAEAQLNVEPFDTDDEGDPADLIDPKCEADENLLNVQFVGQSEDWWRLLEDAPFFDMEHVDPPPPPIDISQQFLCPLCDNESSEEALAARKKRRAKNANKEAAASAPGPLPPPIPNGTSNSTALHT